MENSRNDSPLGIDIDVNGSQNDVLIPPYEYASFNQNMDKGHDRKTKMKLVFMKLNPLIRMLLASIDNLIKEYNVISVMDKSEVEKIKYSSMEKLVAVQKNQLEAWQKLRGELEILKEGSFEYIRESVCEMQSFVFLPIILSFQSFQKIMGEEIQRSTRLDGNNSMKFNFLYRCQEETSICVELVLDILFENKGLINNDSKHFVPELELDPELRIKCVSGATNVFSYLTIQLAQMKQSKGDPQDRKLTLNSVEECLMRVISCMGALCSRFYINNHSSGNRKKFLEYLEMCHNRKWIMEVSRGLNSIFDSDRESSQENKNSSLFSSWTVLNEWSIFAITNVKGNVPLKVETLKTLRNIMELELNDKQQDFLQTNSSSKFQVSSWRTCFPTLFRILFREAMIQLRFKSPQSSPAVAREALETLSCLLKKTLQDSELETKRKRINPDIMDILQSQSTSSIEREPRILSPYLKFFLEKAQGTIPKSLSMIIHLVPTQHSQKVKEAGIELCRSILFDLQDGLIEKVSKHSENDQPGVNDKLHTEALECTIILSRDPDEAVSTKCIEILQQYQTRCNRKESTDDFRRSVTSRVRTLLNSIVSLGQSGRDKELETTMKLISGYLEIMMRTKSSKDKKSVYQGFYYQQLTKGHEKMCLKELFKIDCEVKASAKLIQDAGGEFIIEYAYIRGKMIEVAHGMIHDISKIIGYKKMILFVDECCVDVYEVFSERIANGRSLFDLEHARYCSKECGLFTIAIEMLKAYKENDHHRKQKMLLSLASSLIPLLCSDVLWQLPSRSVLSIQKHANCEGNAKLYSSSISLYSQKQGEENEPISSQALTTNGSLLVCIMNLISTLANSIGSPFSKFIPILLYPLVQKMSELNSQPVRDAAYSTLVNISRVCNYCSMQEMLLTNYNILVEKLSNELGTINRTEMELHSQTVCFYSLSNMINILLESQDGQIDIETSSTRILQLCDMQDSLIEWFGQNFTLNTNALMRYPSIPIGLLSVLGSSIGFVNIILNKLVHECNYGKKEFDDGFQWLDLFIEFELDIDTEQKQEGVKKETHMTNATLGKSIVPGHSLGRLTTNLRKILTTSATLITVPNLILQRKACDLFRDIFQAFSLVQTLAKNGDETDPEITKIGNPLFEAIAHVWPSIDLRLQATTTSFVEFPKKNSDVPRRKIILLLKSIFDMMSELPNLCGDFIANKFETSIWPQMSRLFRCFLVNLEQLARSPLSNIEEELILSILACLDKFFASKTCGTRLSTTTTRVVATILFSFLSRSDTIGDASLNVLKEIHCVDSDCVWRQVLEYSGFGVPFCPLSSPKVVNVTNAGRQTYRDQDSLLEIRCCDLLSYASNLPEQRL